MIFDYIGIILDKQAIANEDFTIKVKLTDTQEKIVLHFKNGALLQYHDESSDSADLTITCPKIALSLLFQRDMEKITSSMKLEGDVSKLELIVDNLNQFEISGGATFNIVEP